METMFEKTTKGLAKKLGKDSHGSSAGLISSAMEIDSGPADADTKAQLKLTWNMELGPIVNCERDLWRRTTSNAGRAEDNTPKPASSAEPVEVMSGM